METIGYALAAVVGVSITSLTAILLWILIIGGARKAEEMQDNDDAR